MECLLYSLNCSPGPWLLENEHPFWSVLYLFVRLWQNTAFSILDCRTVPVTFAFQILVVSLSHGELWFALIHVQVLVLKLIYFHLLFLYLGLWSVQFLKGKHFGNNFQVTDQTHMLIVHLCHFLGRHCWGKITYLQGIHERERRVWGISIEVSTHHVLFRKENRNYFLIFPPQNEDCSKIKSILLFSCLELLVLFCQCWIKLLIYCDTIKRFYNVYHYNVSLSSWLVFNNWPKVFFF